MGLKRSHLMGLLGWAGFGVASLFGAETATLDFAVYGTQIKGLDGASTCQWDGWPTGGSHQYRAGKAVAQNNYSTLNGFPDDDPSTDYGEFMDACFSTNTSWGMGLHQLWSSPNPRQCPGTEWESDTYAGLDWSAMDFSIYDGSRILNDNWITNGNAVRGHTGPIFEAALNRCREQGALMLFWDDLHFTWPVSTWKNNDTWYTIPESEWEEAALYHVSFLKYMVARFSVPMYAVSFMNEPNVSGTERSKWTADEMLRFQIVLRAKLDEAGLTGIKLIPGTPHDNNFTKGEISLLNGSHSYIDPIIDILAVHHFGGQGLQPWLVAHPNTDAWMASGRYDGYFNNANRFLMGPSSNIDETIRLVIWRLVAGYELSGIWQIYGRAGIYHDGFNDMPATFDHASSGTERQRDGAASVLPFVRPGMFVVGGSQGNSPGSSNFSVDGFTGRGHKPCVLITNSASSRTFEITLQNLGVDTFQVYQAHAGSVRQQLSAVSVSDGVLTLTVPKNSVTTLVGDAADSTPRAYLLVKDAADLSTADSDLRNGLLGAGYEVRLLNQELTQEDKDRYAEKRHPIDAMGAACYVVSPSVDSDYAIRAHDAVMAPVVAVGDFARQPLKLDADARIAAGEALSFRDLLDPPADLLVDGKPRATGNRAALPVDADRDTLIAALNWAVDDPPVIPDPNPPVITDGPIVSPKPVSGTTASAAVTANDPDPGETLSYLWSATGPGTVSASGNGPEETLTFTAAGSYTVNVTVTSSSGGTAMGSTPLEVIQTPNELHISTD